MKCKHAADGFIQLSISGGVAPYIYEYSNGAANALNDSLTEGMYSFTVTDNRGCAVSGSAEITAPTQLQATMHHIPPRAYNYSDASVWVVVGGGTAPYEYLWDAAGEKDTIIRGVMHGLHTVTVTDANGCSSEFSENVPNPPLLEAFVEQTRLISCFGKSDGALTVNSQGGVGAHKYMWYRVVGLDTVAVSRYADAANLPAGKYLVKVTDDNDIDAFSELFVLAEPELLQVSTRSKSIACNGDRDGWVEAEASGGIAPYRYLWTTGDTLARVEGLTDDRYFVLAFDAHGCDVGGIAEITVPSGLVIDTLVRRPSCNNVSDGAIEFSVSGGVTPYTYLWEDGSSGTSRRNLAAGVYSLTVKGANGCWKTINFKFDNPKPLTIELGDDIILCKGQTAELNATLPDGDKYLWYRNNTSIAQTPNVLAGESGKYRVELLTTAGCAGSGSINVDVKDYDISADFAVATKAIRHEITKLVYLGYPAPDRTEWIIPDDPYINTVSTGNEFAEIIFEAKGSYIIGLRTFRGECSETVYKQINVSEKAETLEYYEEQQAFMKSFFAYPNPNNGQFTARIELGEPADIRLRLMSMAGTLVDERTLKGEAVYETQYNMKGLNGIYILQLISTKANTSFKLIIQ